MYDAIIIGAGTAGLTAAIYAVRSGKKVLVLETMTIGGQITSSPRVENFPGFKEISGAEFSDRLYEQALSLGAEIELEEVTAVSKNPDGTFTVTADEARTCKSVIIATGSKHRKLGLPHEEELAGRGISYCAVCDGAFYKNKTVAVVGGGNAALQSVQLLSQYCQKVYLIHRRDEFRGEKLLADSISNLANVEFRLNCEVTQLIGETGLSKVKIRNKTDGSECEITLDGLFVAVGQIPENGLFRELVNLDEQGYIIAGDNCKTSCEGIYAAGDCRTKSVRQLTTAAADGTVAGLSI